MDRWRDVHVGGTVLGERLVTAKRAPEAPSRGWSGWSLSSGEQGIVDRCTRGSVTRAQPMRNVYIGYTVPNSAKQCLTVPKSA